MPQLTVEDVGTFRVPAGKRLVNALVDECKVDQLHVCGGHAQCTTCQVCFVSGEPETMRSAERAALESMKLIDHTGVRLSCQVTCDEDMTVRIFSRLHGSGRTNAGPRPSDVIELEPRPMRPNRTPPTNRDTQDRPSPDQLLASGTRPPRSVAIAPAPADVVGDAAPPRGGMPADAQPQTASPLPAYEVESFGPARSPGASSQGLLLNDGRDQPEQPVYRPAIRPPTPVLTVLDDGSMETGEEIRIRTPVFAVGRSGGDLMLPHDVTISGQHAEIRRVGDDGQPQWMLHDTQSINGTFIRIASASLSTNTIVIIGSRRYRFEPGRRRSTDTQARPARGNSSAPSGSPGDSWPALVDLSGRADGVRLELRSDTVTLGGTPGRCDILLDDPLVASHHATVCRNPDGEWRIIAQKTCNGVWVNVASVALTASCFFQCGEQRFRFVIP